MSAEYAAWTKRLVNFKKWLVPEDAWVLPLSEYHFLFHIAQYTENPQFLNTYNKTHTPMPCVSWYETCHPKRGLNQRLCQRIFCTASQRMSKHSPENVQDKQQEIFLLFKFSFIHLWENVRLKFQFPSSPMELQEKKGIKKSHHFSNFRIYFKWTWQS